MQSEQQPITFKSHEASAYLGISEYLLRKLAREGKIAHIRAGKILLFRQAALDNFLQTSEEASVRREPVAVNGIRAVSL